MAKFFLISKTQNHESESLLIRDGMHWYNKDVKTVWRFLGIPVMFYRYYQKLDIDKIKKRQVGYKDK